MCSSSRSTVPSAATPSTTPRCSPCSTPSASAADARVLVLTGAPPAFSAGADLTGVEEGEFAHALGRGAARLHRAADPDHRRRRRSGARRRHPARRRLRPARGDAGEPVRHPGRPARSRRRPLDGRAPRPRAGLAGRPGDARGRRGVRRPPTSTPPAPCTASAISTTPWPGRTELAALAPLTMAAHKLALERSGPPPAADDVVEAARLAAWRSADAVEGRQAFLEKRRPGSQAADSSLHAAWAMPSSWTRRC